MPIFAFYVGSGTWRDRVIRLVSGYRASHVEYVVGGVLGKSNVCISASKRDGNRVRSKPITWKPDNWVFVEVEGDDKAIYRRMIAECGKPYDTLGAVMSVTPFSRHKAGAWFCSGIVAHGLSLPEPHRFTPGSLLNELEAQSRMKQVKEVARND